MYDSLHNLGCVTKSHYRVVFLSKSDNLLHIHNLYFVKLRASLSNFALPLTNTGSKPSTVIKIQIHIPMLLLISPAKTLDFSQTTIKKKSKSRFLPESQELINILKTKTASDLKKLMKVSDKIANLNVERYHRFQTPFNLKNAKQSILAFRGDVYRGLDVDSFDKKDLEFAQSHLRILSGLYGLLRPMDLMQPYRLEMGTRLANEHGKNLYEFWGNKITKTINKDVKSSKSTAIINLASKEYFSAIKTDLLQADVYNIHFKEEKDGKFKIVAFFAKKARGMMCNFIIKNKLADPEHLIAFDMERYCYNEALSSERDLVFTR